ncbi:unnamed protein product [Bursaphelenchus xylophilus]|uniref:Tyrosine-protein kinase n=1 Tax=Bursaphelenchus xylophilus TaxID=6326 RepID=A0A1I7RU24_BURXY|nr:unnamed protein product [Bursaphelenchus xylophilus]CAG9132005.1 unnamed protein product [Bursaphelenchus xylophilus]
MDKLRQKRKDKMASGRELASGRAVTSKEAISKQQKDNKHKKAVLKGSSREENEHKGDPSAPDADAEIKEIASRLNHHQWYHGMMPRDEIEDLLKNDGDFLLRKTDVSKKPRIAISVCYNKRIRHILLTHHDNMWSVRSVKKASVEELVEHHLKEKIPVQSDGTTIQNPIPRPDFYILHDHLTIGPKLGGGAYADVHKGVLRKGGESIDVAIKKCKGNIKKKQRIEFVKEARIMRRFNHRNVVKVIGVAPQEEPILIILELCPGGALSSFLKRQKSLPEDKLAGFVKDACRGLCYLSMRKIIHRDVAARNCLLSKENEAKISDFGLSVSTKELKLDRLNKMPVRWLAPETFRNGLFTTKTDVWSFGIMMWEIYSYCKTDPFPELSNADAKARILSGKNPMEPPKGMPVNMQSFMRLCFTQNPEARPTFENLLRTLCPNEQPPEPENEDFLKELEKFKKEAEESTSKASGMNSFPSNRPSAR